ncbi:MAG: TetR/AcrR family transcriptional regulator [Bacteroidetes bacterium]|nr:TetR/AcrR family transcriptional regulator [Bacteroidota bacterium]MCK4288150.1 TetR/AcrR family transcriptional regulator [Bacteroidales bacterium]MCK4361521.1 TetR/AcrR family transcriptional regulator [Bacteroidales bacterium]MCK4406158.1 TetR/AcrR family transcriptional regulator [Bacteroidales bacterium]MCK4638978.1 TetR/AcrR family transcriptional regulator [Bacteroidales bacterium]
MSPRSKKQFEQIRKSKKALIIEKALELFANNGFHNTSINMIASGAGISKGLIYNYFNSKEDLIKEIVFKGIDELILNIFDPNKDGVLTDEEFVFFINECFDILKKKIEFWKLYFAIIIQPNVMKLVERKLFELVSPLFIILEKYFKAKGIKNPKAEARLFGAIMDGISLNYIVDPDNFPLDTIKDIIIEKYS